MKPSKGFLFRGCKPAAKEASTILINAIGFGIFVSLFLVIFKPFDLANFHGQYNDLKIIGFGLVTFAVILINYLIIPRLVPSLFNNWKNFKEILYSIWNILVIASGNWYYTTLICDDNYNNPNLAEFILITLGVGIFPMTFHMLIQERNRLKKDINSLKIISQFSDENQNETSVKNYIELQGGTRKSLNIPLSDLICVESLGNYCVIYYREDSKVKKETIRNSLKNIEDQVSQFEQIKRCHKSYIVNLMNVNDVSGNTKGYRLDIDHLDFSIPVSRNFPIESIHSSKKQ